MADTLAFAALDDYARARGLLQQVNYTEDGIRSLLGSSDVTATRPLDLAPLLYRVPGDTPLETLIRLFFLNVSVPRIAIERALGPMPLDNWVNAGLLLVCGDTAECQVRLRPVRGLYVASDRPADVRRGARPDYVMGVGSSTQRLANVMERPTMGRTLDLGTGSGFLGLLASSRSDVVVATDKNRRALMFTRFNAELNAIRNVETVAGDLFEPVAGQQFDSIVSNPPFVISPSARYTYRDSGLRGDHFCRALVRAVPAYLREGGFCYLSCNFAHTSAVSWQDAAREWFDNLDCDVLVLSGGSCKAWEYVKTWIQDTEPDDPAELPRRFGEWLRYFEREGIELVTYGIIAVRRRASQSTRVYLEEVPDLGEGGCAADIIRRFELGDYLDARPDAEQLLQECFRLCPDLRIEQILGRTDEGLTAERMRLVMTQGLRNSTAIDSRIAQLVLNVDGKQTLRELLEHVARCHEVTVDQILPEGLRIVRELVCRGYLEPSSRSAAEPQPK